MTGMNLIRLHKRATSRFGTNIHANVVQSNTNNGFEKDLVTIWLQYAKVQYEFKGTNHCLTSSLETDIRSIFQLLQNKNLGLSYSEYYIAMADFELFFGGIRSGIESEDGDDNGESKEKRKICIQKARGITMNGINIGAQPIQLLHEYLRKLEKDIVDGDNVNKTNENDSNNNHNANDGNESRIESVMSKYAKKRSVVMDEGNANSINTNNQKDQNVSEEGKDVMESSSQDNEPGINNGNISFGTSSVASKYLLRSTKRPFPSLRTKIKRERERVYNSSMKGGTFRTLGRPPERISSIDDDDVEDDDEDEENDDKLDESLLDEIANKRPKIAYLVKKTEKITNDYLKFLDEWDPNVKQSKVCKQKLEKIDEKMIEENHQSCNSLASSNNTATNSSRSPNSSTNDIADISAQNSSTNGSKSFDNSSNNIADLSVQSTSTKKDDSVKSLGQNKMGDSVNDIPTHIKASGNSSLSMSLAGADPDFLPLVHEKRVLSVNKVKYLKLGVIGKGGSCKVYRCLTKDCCTVAIKKVKLTGMTRKSIEGYANEIRLLHRLRGSQAIIQLYDSEVDIKRKAIFLVMEAGEADLNHVVSISINLFCS